MNLRSFAIIFLFALIFSLSGCASPTAAPISQAEPASAPTAVPTTSQPKTPLVVFAAGSLIIPFDELATAFEARYPNIDVLAEYHGSIQVMRHATELHEPIDIVATADAALIPMLMYATDDPETGQPYANWYLRFATNHLALAYQSDSLYADEITAENWPEILARPDVKVGLADPRFDASGYRALMAFSLEEERRQRYDLFAPMFDGQFTLPVTIFRDEDLTTITVPEILETRPGAHILIRGASIELIALLQSGDLDYAFEYESVIQQHGLKMLHLPDEINLGEKTFNARYKTVQVNLDFKRFATVKPQFRGEQIGYGITVPSSAPHPDAAALFIAFLLSPEGRAIMEKQSHPMFDTALANGYDNLPAALKSLAAPEATP